jgi:plastocyanin
MYGSRVTAIPESDDVSIETASLDTLHAIHARLAETVLKGEGMHVATPVIPPEPENGTGSHANNDLWLQMIHEGKWPIMATGRLLEDGEPQYNSHDYGDYHLGNLALFPREIQDIISKAAGIEINWRKARGPDAILRPSNAGRDERDPFAGGLRGESYYTSGIDKIDNMTDIPGYFELLNYAMHGEGDKAPQERLATLVDNIASGNIAEDQQRLKETMAVIQRQIGDLVNFITLHEEGHVTTQEEVEKAMADFLHGVARVAEKIQGTYTEPVNTSISEAA